jgi:hypothetical protein
MEGKVSCDFLLSGFFIKILVTQGLPPVSVVTEKKIDSKDFTPKD